MGATDRELTDLTATGDLEAFEQLVARHRNKLYHLARRLTDTDEDAEDVLQEALFNAFRAISGFNGHASLTTWLYRITVNCALTKRRQRTLTTVSLDEPLPGVEGTTARDLEDTSPDPLGMLIASESEQLLGRAIAELPPKHRAPFVLRHIEGLSGDEIASLLKISIPTLKSRLHRTRQVLREALSEHAWN
jgi:RNA polymerase sigma-70 factor (ECF subfamily)